MISIQIPNGAECTGITRYQNTTIIATTDGPYILTEDWMLLKMLPTKDPLDNLAQTPDTYHCSRE
jgi:hypothetical protein